MKNNTLRKVYCKHLLGKSFPVAIIGYHNYGIYVKANETITKDHIEKLIIGLPVWRFDYDDWDKFNEECYRTESNIHKSLAKCLNDYAEVD